MALIIGAFMVHLRSAHILIFMISISTLSYTSVQKSLRTFSISIEFPNKKEVIIRVVIVYNILIIPFLMIMVLVTILNCILFCVVCMYINALYNYYRKVYISNVTNGENRTKYIRKQYKQAPGPAPLPIFGHLIWLSGYKVPFQGLTELSERFGDVYSLTLGTRRCLVVSSLDKIREVLNEKGKFFGGRPDFIRYHKLFGGDRNNCKY